MDGGSSGGSRRGARGARPPASFLDQNETGPPLSQGLDDPPPYLKVWICHWEE